MNVGAVHPVLFSMILVKLRTIVITSPRVDID